MEGALRPRWLRHILAAALVLAGMLLSATSAAAATVPQGTLGINDWTPPSEQTMIETKGAGVDRWRAAMFWYLIEREPGVRDWSDYDELVGAAARQDTSLLMVIASCPAWACADLSGPPRGEALAAHQDFVREAVSRYGTDGSYWADHPELPYRPVTEWQVWNEVNAAEFWQPGPNASEYAAFLRAEAAVIRAADPAATVVLSGLTDYGQVSASEFLDQLYAQPGFAESFDVLALHAYAYDTAAVGRMLDRFTAVSERHGDTARPLWITEIGWGTDAPNVEGGVAPERQAELLRTSLDTLIGCGERWELDRTYWFAYRDLQAPAGEADLAGYHTGLHYLDGRPKPAWSALSEYRAGAQLNSSCEAVGERTVAAKAPDTRVRGKRRARTGRRTRLHLRATVRGATFQCRLFRVRKTRALRAVRGYARWRSCRRTFKTRRLWRGRYVFRARAIDTAGRVDRTPAARRIVVRGKRSIGPRRARR